MLHLTYNKNLTLEENYIKNKLEYYAECLDNYMDGKLKISDRKFQEFEKYVEIIKTKDIDDKLFLYAKYLLDFLHKETHYKQYIRRVKLQKIKKSNVTKNQIKRT